MVVATPQPAVPAGGNLGSIGALADEVKSLRAQIAGLEGQAKPLREQLAQVEQRLVERMVEGEVQNFTQSGQTFYLTHRNYVKLRAAARSALVPFLKEHDLGMFVSETVDERGLVEWVNEQLEEERELPAPIAEAISRFETVGVAVKKAS